MTIRRSPSALVLAAVVSAGHAAGWATSAAADDPPPIAVRPDGTGTGLHSALPRPGAVLDAMPVVRPPPAARVGRSAQQIAEPGPIEVDTTGATGDGLADPGLGERPTPREAREESDLGETIMRPRGGSATGGKPDVPPER